MLVWPFTRLNRFQISILSVDRASRNSKSIDNRLGRLGRRSVPKNDGAKNDTGMGYGAIFK